MAGAAPDALSRAVACYHPIKAWRSGSVNPSGKRSLQFHPRGAFGDAFAIACGQCIGCRIAKARDWDTRVEHELVAERARAAAEGREFGAIFATFTYDPEHLPADGSLSRAHLQLAHKRLRERLRARNRRTRIRFLSVGEYGDRTERPHYHGIYLGEGFYSERRRVGRSGSNSLYEADLLSEAWGLGIVNFGDVSSGAGGYVARYCVKKVNGDRAEAHYRGRVPEFLLCSQGFGVSTFNRFRSDFFPADEAVIRGKVRRVPRAYERYVDPVELAEIKLERARLAGKLWRDRTARRLADREEVARARLSLNPRS